MGAARVVFTDRHGGVSRPPYASANLADHVGDEPAAVAENRARVAARSGMSRPDEWAWIQQVHGRDVVRFDVPAEAAAVREADASFTTATGLPLVVLTADCAPLALVADGAVAAVHAGWAGLEAGVVERAVEAVRRVARGPLRAVLGPCISPARYEFGADLLERLVTRFGESVAAVSDSGSPALDIPAAVRCALQRAGVDELDDVGICTASSPDYFSYRRDGETGRQAMLVVRQP